MKSYICSVCGYSYDEESAEKNSDEFLIPFHELPSEWTCPMCGVSLELFVEAPTTDKQQDIITGKSNNL